MSSPAFLDDPRLLAPRQVRRIELAGGAFELVHPEPLAPYERCIGQWLERWAAEKPDALAFAEPAPGGGWVRLSWRALRRRVGAVAQALLDISLDGSRPVAILSDNSLNHLVLMLAAAHVGVPACSISSAYCRLAGGDFSRIHGILQALRPALAYGADAATYAPALAGCGVPGLRQAYSRGADTVPGALDFEALAATPQTPAVMQAFAAVDGDTHAKYLLTSGSTGSPKVVINTQRMLCANQQMIAQTLRFLGHEPPVLLDWLPWSHTFGGNHNLNIVLRHGGTLYIDDGRPMPGLIDKTLAHLRPGPDAVQPTIYFNVPRGFDMLLPALESDDALARAFFGRLRMAFYAGAALPAATWRRLVSCCARVREEPLWLTTSWGATETAPSIASVHWRLDRPGVIGLPMPGARLKFVPNAGKLELRVKGELVTPGYRGNPQATAAAFDEDGYYRIGDAGRLADPADPAQGVVFDGRVAEDFKLASGTWVSVGTLRPRLVSALSPLAQDAVITGHDRDEVGALVFLTEAARARPRAEVAAEIATRLAALKAEGGGSSQVPARALLLDDAPHAASGEMTDKGYINQRLALQRRAEQVEALYGDGPGVIRA